MVLIKVVLAVVEGEAVLISTLLLVLVVVTGFQVTCAGAKLLIIGLWLVGCCVSTDFRVYVETVDAGDKSIIIGSERDVFADL